MVLFLGGTDSDSGGIFTHIALFIFATLASMYFNHGQSFLDLPTLSADGAHFRYHPIKVSPANFNHRRRKWPCSLA